MAERLGLTMRVDEAENGAESRDCLAQDWPRFMKFALPGVEFVPIPNLGRDSSRWAESWGLDGLVLTGGNDVGQNPQRDETENELLAWAMGKRLPALGICRGLQLIQTHLGGTLSRIPGEAHVAVQHDVDMLTPRPGLRQRRKVNSFHRWGIQVAALAKPLTAVALCPGGWVEAAASTDAPVLGVMWHPERSHPTQSEDVELFRDFFGRSR